MTRKLVAPGKGRRPPHSSFCRVGNERLGPGTAALPRPNWTTVVGSVLRGLFGRRHPHPASSRTHNLTSLGADGASATGTRSPRGASANRPLGGPATGSGEFAPRSGHRGRVGCAAGPEVSRLTLTSSATVRGGGGARCRGRHAATIVERVARQTLWVFGRGEALGEVTCASRTRADRRRRRPSRPTATGSIQAADAGSEARPLTTGGGRLGHSGQHRRPRATLIGNEQRTCLRSGGAVPGGTACPAGSASSLLRPA